MKTQTNIDQGGAAGSGRSVSAETVVHSELDPRALEFLIEACDNFLLSWIHDNAPEDVFNVAWAASYLHWLEKETLKNGGQAPADETPYLGRYVLTALNALGRMNHLP